MNKKDEIRVLYNQFSSIDFSNQRQRFHIVEKLHQAYFTFNYDSAVFYSRKLVDIANQLGEKGLINVARLRVSETLLASGLFAVVKDSLEEISSAALSDSLRVKYHYLNARLYIDMGNYYQGPFYSEKFSHIISAHLDSAIANAKENTHMQYSLNGLRCIWNNKYEEAKEVFSELFDRFEPTGRQYAVDASTFAFVYSALGEPGKELEWLLKAAVHDSQFGVRHYLKSIEMAAKHHIMLDIHEPIKATGIRRTYPNAMTREGSRGMEFNAWGPDGGNPPEHETILPFTRLLGGPMDFTPGIFDISISNKPNNQVNTTLAKQLALYVVIYSPLHMAADLPENYGGQPAFQFIRDVPVDWEDTEVLNGEIGEYITIARQDRNSDDWFLGSISDEKERTFTVDLDFLEPDTKYKAVFYRDAANAHFKDNPLDIIIEEKEVTSDTSITMHLASGGGHAVHFLKLRE
jgi:tetratricopeptide (TPR) repeat protein